MIDAAMNSQQVKPQIKCKRSIVSKLASINKKLKKTFRFEKFQVGV
jgi:hypothetical protein